jgi:hypothetical protein
VLDRVGRCNEAGAAYDEYAALVRPFDPSAADMALRIKGLCYAPATVDPSVAAVSVALVAGEDAKALLVADVDLSRGEPASPWLTYDRAVALARLGRTDEAVATFRAAEGAFGGDEQLGRGRLLAVYGRARALVDAYRCKDARAAYEEYAGLVRATDSGEARRMTVYADDCR